MRQFCGSIELLIGSVPLIGDLLDVVFKGNSRNARLLVVALDAKVDRLDALWEYSRHLTCLQNPGWKLSF